MEIIARDGEAVHLRTGHLDSLRILGGIDFAGDGQAGCGSSCGNQLDDRQPAGQGPGTPVLRNVTEEAVLDLVPFRCAGRVVADADGQADLVSQRLEFALPQRDPLEPPPSAVIISRSAPG
jgi:hypothetical protein